MGQRTDTYIQITIGEIKARTKVITNTDKSPKFDDLLVFEDVNFDQEIVLIMFDEDKVADDEAVGELKCLIKDLDLVREGPREIYESNIKVGKVHL